MRYTILLQPEPEGGYTVTCPALPAAITWGETYEQAMTMARECIELVLETMGAAHLKLSELHPILR